jgi:hypothetical protein
MALRVAELESSKGHVPVGDVHKSLSLRRTREASDQALLQFELCGVGLHKDSRCSFRVCHTCFTRFKCALKVARSEMGSVEELQGVPPRPTTTTTNLLEKSFSFDNGRKILVSAY